MSSFISPVSSQSCFPTESPEAVRREVKEQLNKVWPHEEIATLANKRIKHIKDELTPRLEHVEVELGKIGLAIKNVANSVAEIKLSDTNFFDRVKSMELRIEKMLSPSEEYLNLQSQNRRDLIAIIVTVLSVATIIIGAIVAVALL